MDEKISVKAIIISSKPGQLGNMLFLFSHFIAFGIEKNICIKAPAFEEYADYFDSTHNSLIPSYPQNNSKLKSKWLRRFIYSSVLLFAKIVHRSGLNNKLVTSVFIDWDESLNLEDESDLKLFNSRYVFISGWLYRSNANIQKYKASITDFFKPTSFHLNRINMVIPQGHEILAGVHIRHGDYRTFEGGKYFFEVRQYIGLMKKLMVMLPGRTVLFIICSNSKLSREDFQGIPVVFGTGDELEDLYALSKCNYLLGPPSTFTMWASFFGDVPLYQVHDIETNFSLEQFKVISG